MKKLIVMLALAMFGFTNFTAQASARFITNGYQQSMTKSGKPDKRYNANKHLKKDGTSDMRYNTSKKAAAKKRP